MKRKISYMQIGFYRTKRKCFFILAALFIITCCNSATCMASGMSADAFSLSHDEIETLTEKAKQGDMEAADRLGWYYMMTELDQERASYFFRIPAKAGNARIQHTLANLLMSSSSLEQQQKGVNWLEISAKNGYRLSQTSLARLYEKGESVEKDYCKAKFWYEKSARSGYGYSMIILSEYFEEGKCVDRNNIEAYVWALGAKNYSLSNSPVWKKSIKRIAYFEKKLSESEIKQAKDEYEKLLEGIEDSGDRKDEGE